MTIKTEDNTAGDIHAEETVSALFKLLSHHRRRIAVQYLATQVGTTSVSDVADQIALLEGEHTHDRYERICTSLVHAHPPMLTDGGVIEYDHEREVLKLRDQGAGMLPYLELASAD
ncbi:hypothetical protein [Natronomonas sp.]|uniref:DUF7344 domain-containing protein n=1 Tax=Natronomonas sp. TaxID=2184060 RepID=UPI003974E58A